MHIVCKYGCGYEGNAVPYVGFFPQEAITKANELDPHMPKFGYHLGVDCPGCGKWQKWIKQDAESLLGMKFYCAGPDNKIAPSNMSLIAMNIGFEIRGGRLL